MSNFSSEIQLDSYQAEAIARGLFAVAKADGMHEREAALVASFWAETGGSEKSLGELERRDAISGEELAAALTSREVRLVFLKTAVLLTWADGQVTEPERALVRKYSEALDLTNKLPELETSVKEFLLSHLSHIQNVDAVAGVARKLEL